MNGTNSQLLAIQVLIYVILFALLAFAVWGVYRAYKQRQAYKVGVIMSLGAVIGALGGMLLENVGVGLVIGITIGFAAGAGLSHLHNKE